MKRRAKRAFALVGVLAVPLLLGSSGVSAALPKAPDLSTKSAVVAYLQSIHVDPSTLTWQEGLLNYAGPSCPGVGWNCTTSTHVVQLATPGGENRVECAPEDDVVSSTNDPGNQSCVIMQGGPAGNNHAKCQEKSHNEEVTQDCTITQTGDKNHSDIHQEDDANVGLQDALQTAHVEQNGHDNHSEIHQDVHQSLTAGDGQVQDAHQMVLVQQTSTGSTNFSHVHQTQDQRESGTATTQLQNTAERNFGCGQTKPFPNQCADVTQDGTGAPNGAKNDSHLHQMIGERESTKASGATQQQMVPTTGQEGDIHQQNDVGVGSNHDHAHQTLSQRAAAPSGTSVFQSQQTDPICCGFSQVGGAENREDIDQSTTQSASDPNANQFASLFGQVEQTSGGDAPTLAPAAPTGPNNKCSIDQHGRNNSGGDHFSVSGTGFECEFLTLETTCTSGGIDAPTQPESTACTSSEGGGESALALPALVMLTSTPTYGQEIAMPDYTAEPADFVDDP